MKSLYEMAYAQYEAAHYSDAEVLFLALIGTHAQEPAYWYGLSSAQFMQQEYEKAEKSLHSGLLLHPNHNESKLLLAEVYVEQKCFEKAKNLLKTVHVHTKTLEKKLEWLQFRVKTRTV